MTIDDALTQKISVVGLGPMGSAMARVLHRSGHTVTVWNRSAGKVAALAEEGFAAAASAADAIRASPLTLVCVANEVAMDDIYAGEGMSEAFSGRTVVNLTTESIEATKRHAFTTRGFGGSYLDAGILSYPRAIGSADAVILYSGDKNSFETNESLLSRLAGSQRYVGDGESDATVAYAAAWTYYYGALGGFFEAAALARTAGVEIAEVRELAVVMTTQLLGGMDDAVQRLRDDDFSGDQATINGHIDGIPTFVKDAARLGVETRILSAFVDHCRRAAERGHGVEDIAMLVRTMQQR